MAGCSVIYNVAGVNTLCVDDPAPMLRTNIAGPPVVVRAAARAGVGADRPHLLGGDDRRGVGRDGARGHAAPRLVPVDVRALEDRGRAAAFEAGRQHGVEVVCVNPSSVQGPGRAGGTARFLLAYLDGRLKVFVPTNVSLVDIADCAEGHVLAAERGVRASATC